MQSGDLVAQLKNIAQGYIAKKGDPSWSVIAKTDNYEAFGITHEGSPGIINFAHYDGTSIDKFIKFFENYA